MALYSNNRTIVTGLSAMVCVWGYPSDDCMNVLLGAICFVTSFIIMLTVYDGK